MSFDTALSPLRCAPLFYDFDFDGLLLAVRAFKGALIVVWRIGRLSILASHI